MYDLKILVTTIGGLTSPDLFYALSNNNERKIYTIGIDAFSHPSSKHLVDLFLVSPNSSIDEKSFVLFVKEICETHNINLIIPCGNEDNLALSKYQSLINIPIMLGSGYPMLVQAYDKGIVYEKLQNFLPDHAPKFKIFNSYSGFKEALKFFNFPSTNLIIKPRFGRGGRGVYQIVSSIDFNTFFNNKPKGEILFNQLDEILFNQQTFDDLILMEVLQEPFLSAYSLCHKGENLITLQHIREWGSASQTYRGLVSYNQELEKICSKIIRLFNLSYTNNMELAFNKDGKIVLFDLNPRIGASSCIDADIGLNFPYLAIKLLLGEKITFDKNNFKQQKRFIRYFSHTWTSDEI